MNDLVKLALVAGAAYLLIRFMTKETPGKGIGGVRPGQFSSTGKPSPKDENTGPITVPVNISDGDYTGAMRGNMVMITQATGFTHAGYKFRVPVAIRGKCAVGVKVVQGKATVLIPPLQEMVDGKTMSDLGQAEIPLQNGICVQDFVSMQSPHDGSIFTVNGCAAEELSKIGWNEAKSLKSFVY